MFRKKIFVLLPPLPLSYPLFPLLLKSPRFSSILFTYIHLYSIFFASLLSLHFSSFFWLLFVLFFFSVSLLLAYLHSQSISQSHCLCSSLQSYCCAVFIPRVAELSSFWVRFITTQRSHSVMAVERLAVGANVLFFCFPLLYKQRRCLFVKICLRENCLIVIIIMIFLQGVCSFEPLSSRYKKQKTKEELRNAVEYRKQRVIFSSRDLEWN